MNRLLSSNLLVPEGNLKIFGENYRFYVIVRIISILGFLFHSGFIFLFAFLGVQFLCVINILFSLIFILCLILANKGYIKTSFFTEWTEISLHAVLAVMYLGWNSGYNYYMLCVFFYIFICNELTTIKKIFFVFFNCILYLFVNYLSYFSGPIITMSPQCIKILNCLNIILVFNFIGFATYFENVTVVEAEKNFKEINNKLKVISQKDPLTNIYNRRRMTLEINNLIDLFSANKTPFSLVMADIDDFKNINDTYGHNCGDFVLVTITSIISDLLESKGHWGRWGGEEFLFLLPEMDIDTCLPIVQDIRDAIASYDFKYNGKRFSITMTFGISMYNKEMDILELINLADTALYSGKARGKGCVVVS